MSTNAPPPQGPPTPPPDGTTAPGTPASAGAPTPDPARRACPACGASNAATASFCWQCLTALGAAPAAGGYVPPGGATAGPLGRPPTSTFGERTYENRQPVTNDLDAVIPLPPSRRRSPVGTTVRILVPLAVAVAAFWLGWRLFAGGIQVPDTLAGIPIRTDAPSRQLVGLIEEAMEGLGVEARAAVYGEPGAVSPSVMLLVMDGVPEGSAETAFQTFTIGLAQSGTGAIDPGDIQRRDFEGVTYLCAPTSAQIRAVCMWQFEDRVGFVSSYDRDLAGTFQITISAANQLSG